MLRLHVAEARVVDACRVMSTWYIASQNPGTSSFLDTNLVAVDFWVRKPAESLDPDGIKEVAAGHHPEWDRKTVGVRTNFARQLEQFASVVKVGDDVVTFDGAARDLVLVGKVRGPYRYEDPSTIPEHPHVRVVEWVGTVGRASLPDGGAAIEYVRGVTVRRLSEGPTRPATVLDDPPPPPVELSSRRPVDAASPDSFTWEPSSGQHRYVLRHTFRGGASERPLLVVMLNPAANHLPGFRRSTTCHAVRRWGEAHDYDGAVYVNLFSHIEPNSTFLRRVPADELNGTGADEAIERIGGEFGGVAIAGWGDLPPGLDRSRYDARVAQVERLLGRPLMCLGVTQRGYPRHGRGWRPTDELVPLRRV